MKLGNDLRKFRFLTGEMSQEALAGMVGVTRQTIISIEKGRFNPSALLALRIARALDKRVEDIFYLKEDDRSPSTERI